MAMCLEYIVSSSLSVSGSSLDFDVALLPKMGSSSFRELPIKFVTNDLKVSCKNIQNQQRYNQKVLNITVLIEEKSK